MSDHHQRCYYERGGVTLARAGREGSDTSPDAQRSRQDENMKSASPGPGAVPEADAVLFRRYRQDGDERALEALFARHWPRTVRLAWRIAGDPALAEDVAQRSFLKVARKPGRCRDDKAFAGWLTGIVVNETRAAARAQRRRNAHERTAATDRGLSSWKEGGEDSDLAVAVTSQLQRLPDALRVPLVLRYFEGHSHREVAGVLGLRDGTASSRLRRGLESLRDSLSRMGLATTAPSLETLLRQVSNGGAQAPPAWTLPPAPTLATLDVAARYSILATLSAKSVLQVAALVLLLVVVLGAVLTMTGTEWASPGSSRAEGSPGETGTQALSHRAMRAGERLAALAAQAVAAVDELTAGNAGSGSDPSSNWAESAEAEIPPLRETLLEALAEARKQLAESPSAESVREVELLEQKLEQLERWAVPDQPGNADQ
ncbi:RNA polymerase sigma factor [Planctomycetota bacterium]